MNNQEKLVSAQQLCKQGQKNQAAQLLREIIQDTPNHTAAWYGLAMCAANVEPKRACLQKVLAIEPQHAGAKAALARLEADALAAKTGKKTRFFPPPPASSTKTPLVRKKKNGFSKILGGAISFLFLVGVSIALSVYFSRQATEQAQQAAATAAAAEVAKIAQASFSQTSTAQANITAQKQMAQRQQQTIAALKLTQQVTPPPPPTQQPLQAPAAPVAAEPAAPISNPEVEITGGQLPLTVTELTSPIIYGQLGKISIQTQPGVTGSIAIFSTDGQATGVGLGDQIADENGLITWEWETTVATPAIGNWQIQVFVRSADGLQNTATMNLTVIQG